jgi:hypothetical protein
MNLKWKSLQILLTLVPALAFSIVEFEVWTSALCWFLFGLFPRVQFYIGSLTKVLRRETTVPMHVDWSISRFGEFLMLMLGEAIISIIIVGFPKPTAEFVSTYFFCYFLIATLGLSLFASFPAHADRRKFFSSLHKTNFLKKTPSGEVLNEPFCTICW